MRFLFRISKSVWVVTLACLVGLTAPVSMVECAFAAAPIFTLEQQLVQEDATKLAAGLAATGMRPAVPEFFIEQNLRWRSVMRLKRVVRRLAQTSPSPNRSNQMPILSNRFWIHRSRSAGVLKP